MNRICLVNPPYGAFMQRLDAPFNLLYVAAIAERERWEASVVDMERLDDPVPEAEVYGVTASSPQWMNAVKLASRLRAEHPESLLLTGGNHVSAVQSDFYGTDFDGCIVGEGEEALANLLRNYEALYKNINVKSAFIHHTSLIEDLDSIPFPARHLVDWSKYKRGIYWGKTRLADAVSMITSRGCPMNCIFCSSHVVFGRRTRWRSVGNVVVEVKEVKEKYGFDGLNFHDDTFTLNRDHTLKLCKALEDLEVVWRCLTRVNTVDSKLLEAMYRAGCKEIILGVESGSQRVLDKLRKGVTVQQNLRAMWMVKKSGIQLKVGIIVGSPGESWKTVRETEKLLKECPPDFWNVSVFTPYPGSFAYDHPGELGLKILTRNLEEYSMVGRDYKGNVVCETEEMKKADIEQARDELIDLCLSLAPQYGGD